MTAAEAIAAMRRRALSPLEYRDVQLSRADAQAERLNPFAFVAADRARTEAKAAEPAFMAEESLGPLHGLPVHVKDLCPTADIPAEYGSAVKAGKVPDHDDVLVRRLRQAGAVVFAESTTPEFGHKGQTDGPHFGTTRNPRNTASYASGSSGSAACAVAAGIGPLGLGKDGAGSVRVLAAACGAIGLKPSPGLLPYEEAVDAFFNYAAAGPLSRSVQDAALMLETLAGPDPVDLWSLAALRPRGTRAGSTLHGLRVRHIPKLHNHHIARDVADNTRAVLALLAARGAHVGELRDDIDWMEHQGRIMYQPNIAIVGGPDLAEFRDRMDPVHRGLI